MSIESIGRTLLIGGVVIVGGTIAAVAAPFVSVVAIPIFAIKALPKYFKHRALYQRTLTNETRAPYGRVEGQDYTRWDGRAIDEAQLTEQELRNRRRHERIGEYIHGQKFSSFHFPLAENRGFQTPEDIEWLKLEKKRVKAKNALDEDVKTIRAFAKALIPIIGLLWVLGTEIQPGGASEIGCRTCMFGGSEDEHWSLTKAIRFHQVKIEDRRKRVVKNFKRTAASHVKIKTSEIETATVFKFEKIDNNFNPQKIFVSTPEGEELEIAVETIQLLEPVIESFDTYFSDDEKAFLKEKGISFDELGWIELPEEYTVQVLDGILNPDTWYVIVRDRRNNALIESYGQDKSSEPRISPIAVKEEFEQFLQERRNNLN